MNHAQHLDPERLAAFMDGSMTREERRAVEAHAADCAHCLQLLAAMARTEPEPQASGWRMPLVMRWAVPAAVAATALALWVNVDRRAREAQPAVAEKAPIDAVSPTPAPAPAPAAEPSSAAQSTQETGARALKPSVQGGVGRDAAKQVSPRADVQNRERSAFRDEKRQDAQQNETVPRRAAAEEKPATLPAVAEIAASPAPGARGGAPAAAAAPPPAALPETRVQPTAADRMLRQARQAIRIVDVVSPDPLVRWRVTGAVIERSTDGGKTWAAPVTVSQTGLLAGASSSPTVAWLVGRGGTVFRTTDGLNWLRLAFPETVDLTAVRSVSDREADVTTADGRVFRTADGGRTWALQETPGSSF